MIKDIDRKRLWGRSGSRCAICNLELTQAAGLDSIVGDEAHVRARNAGGPRYEPDYPADHLDSYVNLILLCKVDHKLVDDRPDVYPANRLLKLKSSHEDHVKRRLNSARVGWVKAPLFSVIADGTELMSVIGPAMIYSFGHDHPRDAGVADTIGGFLQSLQDWGDISDDIGPSGRMSAAMDLDKQMTDLREVGYAVVGGRGRYLAAKDLEVAACAIRVVALAVAGDAQHSG